MELVGAPFTTKRKIKSVEFENVPGILSQGLYKYNFDKMPSVDVWTENSRVISSNAFSRIIGIYSCGLLKAM